MNGYTCVKGETRCEKVIERSRFLSACKKTETEEEAREFLESVKKEHPFATHNCYAFVAEQGKIARYSDDGEPQGTAGLPILEVIKAKGLCDTTVVVTRYFGGVKLGAGGLVRAYSGATADVLSLCEKEEHIPSVLFSVTLSYDKYSSFLKKKEQYKHAVLSSDFGEEIVLRLAVPHSEADRFEAELVDYFAGKLPISRLKEDYAVY